MRPWVGWSRLVAPELRWQMCVEPGDERAQPREPEKGSPSGDGEDWDSALRQLILREQVAATVRSGQEVSIGAADLLVLTSTCAQLVHACLLNEPLGLTQEQVRAVHEATLRALEALQKGRERGRGEQGRAA